MLHDAVQLADEGPVVIRYPRGAARQVSEHDVGAGLGARKVLQAEDPSSATCVIAVGKMLEIAEQAAAAAADRGAGVTVWDARCCAPLDADMIADAAAHRRVITIEDGIRDGGIGMTAAAEIADIDPSVPIDILGLPTKFMPHDPKTAAIHARYGLDAASLTDVIVG